MNRAVLPPCLDRANSPDIPACMKKFNLAMALTVSLALLAPALAQDVPVGNLEVPGNGSFQSGIGFISGWVCAGEVVEVVLNGDQRLPVTARGLARGDTEAACGDQNNGFLTIWNWNLMGEGTHTAALVVDGQTLRRHSFTVTTLGEEFVRDVEKDVTVEDFPGPGETVTLRWQQPVQNFVIVPAATRSPGPKPCQGSQLPLACPPGLVNAPSTGFSQAITLSTFVPRASQVDANGEWHATGLTPPTTTTPLATSSPPSRREAWPTTTTLTLWIDAEGLLRWLQTKVLPGRGIELSQIQADGSNAYMLGNITLFRIEGFKVTLDIRMQERGSLVSVAYGTPNSDPGDAMTLLLY